MLANKQVHQKRICPGLVCTICVYAADLSWEDARRPKWSRPPAMDVCRPTHGERCKIGFFANYRFLSDWTLTHCLAPSEWILDWLMLNTHTRVTTPALDCWMTDCQWQTGLMVMSWVLKILLKNSHLFAHILELIRSITHRVVVAPASRSCPCVWRTAEEPFPDWAHPRINTHNGRYLLFRLLCLYPWRAT